MTCAILIILSNYQIGYFKGHKDLDLSSFIMSLEAKDYSKIKVECFTLFSTGSDLQESLETPSSF